MSSLNFTPKMVRIIPLYSTYKMRLFVLFSTIVLSFIEMREGVVAAKMEREWKYNARCYTIRKDINHSISAQLDFLVFLQSVLPCVAVAMYDTESFVIPFA